MNSSDILIEDITITDIGKKIKIDVFNFELNVSCIVLVKLLRSDGSLIQQNEFILEGDDYLNWKEDDYLVNYVCQKYGYMKKNIF